MAVPDMLSRRPKVLVIDVGGTHVKVLASGRREPREIPSGPSLTASGMVAAVKRLAADWRYDAVSIGYPGVVVHGRPVAEPYNLGPGWVSFDFRRAFGRPVRIINDAAMQALGRRGLERLGKKRWRRHVADVAERLQAALEADDVVVGGGNAKLLKTLPAGVRRGDNANAFLGGLRLWDDRLAHADGVRAHDAHGRRSRGLGRVRG